MPRVHSTLWHRAVHSSKGSQPVVRVTESKVHNPHDARSPGSVRATTYRSTVTHVLKEVTSRWPGVCSGWGTVLGSFPVTRTATRLQGAELDKI